MTNTTFPHTASASTIANVNNAVAAIRRAGAFSIANPTVRLADNPHVGGQASFIRAAFGTKNVIWSCTRCGTCTVAITDNGVSACCNADVNVNITSATIAAKFVARNA
jgi:hypothetical protein